MALERTYDITYAIEHNGCITGALMDAKPAGTNTTITYLSGESNYEAQKDEQTRQMEKIQTEFRTTDNTVCSIDAPGLSCEEKIAPPGLKSEEVTKGVTNLHENHNEVIKLRTHKADLLYQEEHKLQNADVKTRPEDATSTKEGDNNISNEIQEHDGKGVSTEEDNERQEEKVDGSSQKEEVIVFHRAEESNVVLANEDFNITHQERQISAGSESDLQVNQNGKEGCVSHSGDETISTLRDEAVCFAADDKAKFCEADRNELKDPCDPHPKQLDVSNAQHVESRGSPLLQKNEGIFEVKESGENVSTAASNQDPVNIGFQTPLQSEADESSFCPRGAIAQNIHQGELLLYRLRLVQRNQELQQVSDGPSASNTVAMVMANDTVKTVTMRPGAEQEYKEQKGDLPHRFENTQERDREKEQTHIEAMGTSSAGTGEHRQVKMRKDVSHDVPSDKGVSTLFVQGGIHEFPCSQSTKPLEETPIQREIRQGLERERSLRRSRGLDDWDSKSQELVEIPVKRPLDVPDDFSWTNVGFVAEKRLAKRKMLQDINQEAKKEQAVKKLGNAPGFFDEGHAQELKELKERKMIFEALQQGKKVDRQSLSKGRKLSSSFTDKNAESLVSQGESLQFVCKLERTCSLDLFTNYHLKESSAALPDSESDPNDTDSHKKSQMKHFDDDATSASSQETQPISLRSSISLSSLDWDSEAMLSRLDKEKQDEESSILKGKNPFFQLRPSLSLRPDVEQEIREAMEREQELRRLRSRLYGDNWNKQGGRQEGNTQSPCPHSVSTGSDHVYSGKLTLIWPPPRSKVEEEPGHPKLVGQRRTLWNYWEISLANSSCNEKE